MSYDKLKKTCNGLKIYYEQKGRDDYTDNSGKVYEFNKNYATCLCWEKFNLFNILKNIKNNTNYGN